MENVLLYVFDLNAGEKKRFSKTKRMFYYYLRKIDRRAIEYRTKSVILVPETMEAQLDALFKKFQSDMTVYKFVVEEEKTL